MENRTIANLFTIQQQLQASLELVEDELRRIPFERLLSILPEDMRPVCTVIATEPIEGGEVDVYGGNIFLAVFPKLPDIGFLFQSFRNSSDAAEFHFRSIPGGTHACGICACMIDQSFSSETLTIELECVEQMVINKCGKNLATPLPALKYREGWKLLLEAHPAIKDWITAERLH